MRVENQIRPIAVGKGNWLFAGSLRAGQRAAAVMSLIQSAKLNGHDPYAYLKDVFLRLPTQPIAASTNCCRIVGVHLSDSRVLGSTLSKRPGSTGQCLHPCT